MPGFVEIKTYFYFLWITKARRSHFKSTALHSAFSLYKPGAPAEGTDRSQGKDGLPDVQERKIYEVLIRKCHFYLLAIFQKLILSFSCKRVIVDTHTLPLLLIFHVVILILKPPSDGTLPFRVPIFLMHTCQRPSLPSRPCAQSLLNKRTPQLKASISFLSSLSHIDPPAPQSTFSLWATSPANVGWGSGGVMEDRGRDTGDGWALSERCIHQTRAGFHFCVKSCYQTGAGYAGWEKGAEGGGAEKKTGQML